MRERERERERERAQGGFSYSWEIGHIRTGMKRNWKEKERKKNSVQFKND